MKLDKFKQLKIFSSMPDRATERSKRKKTFTFGLLGLLVVMNLLDGIFTLVWVLSGQATEANPLMALLIDAHPLLFIIFKIALVNLGAILLWRLYHRRFALIAASFCVSVYASILGLHVVMAVV